MLKLILRILFFLFGVSIFAMALSLIPIETFTFRNWESMIWKERHPTIGNFYPSIKSVRDESGDLGHNSRYDVIKKNVHWETDKNGFRNNQDTEGSYDIVLVGDSNSVGSGTTQEENLSNQIYREIHSNVFNYSPMDIDAYFMNNLIVMGIHPKVVIYEKIEREIPIIAKFDDKDIDLNHKYTIKNKIKNKIRSFVSDNIKLYLLIARDRFYKTEPLNFIQGKIDSAFGKFNLPVSVGAENILFYNKSFFNREIKDDEIKLIADKLEKISNDFAKQGIKFIFVPVPNKESIYVELLPKDKLPLKSKYFLINLKKELDSRGIKSVDTYTNFRSSFLAGNRIYFADDTHWNTNGIELAAKLIAHKIKN
jgi:hypothetical protein